MDLKHEIKKNGFLVLGFRKSIKYAESLLKQDETVLYVCTGNISSVPVNQRIGLDTLNIKGKEACVFVVTDKRIFHCFSALGTKKFKEVFYENVQSIDHINNKLTNSGKIRISQITDTLTLDLMKAKADEMQAAIEMAMNTRRSQQGSQNSSIYTDEIVKLKNLLDIGAITPDEYELKKKQMLGI